MSTAPRPGHYIKDQPFPAGLEQCSQDSASNAWLPNRPFGWTGRNYVRAVHLRTMNLPTVGIPSNPPDARKCRSGCQSDETICHVLQVCPQTQEARIKRHDYVVRKIKDHCDRKGFATELESHVRLHDGRLDKRDLVVHVADNNTIICDVQISWDSSDLAHAWRAKRDRYGNDDFKRAASKKWPDRSLIFTPLVIGARGIWPSCNKSVESYMRIPTIVKKSCEYKRRHEMGFFNSQYIYAIYP